MNESRVSPQVEELLERIDDRLAGGESLELEFKKAAGRLPSSLWPTISAFANTNGGWVVLGVDEDVRPVTLTGVGNADHLLQDFYNLMRNPQKVSCEVCGPGDATVERVDGREAIIIRVRPAPRRMRPVFIENDLLRGTYVRRHSGDAHCTLPEIERMIREKSDVSVDSTVLPRYGLDDLDRDVLSRYRQRFVLVRPEDFRHGLSDVEFLRSISGWRHDRDTDEEGLTVAGLLMFGRRESLREWRNRHYIDFRLLPVLAYPATWDDRLLWDGCLFGAFEAITPRLGVALQTPLRFEGVTRIDDTQAHKAVREALVNLLVHADYAERTSSLVFCSPDGFQFINPGSSRVPFEELTVGNHSDARNPNLAFMFRMVNLAEEAGSGIPRIFEFWSELGYQRPRIQTDADSYEFTLELRHADLILQRDRDWLQLVDPTLDGAEHLALLAALHEDGVDNARLRSTTGLHPADATKVLRSLKARELLIRTGWGRGAWYQLGPAALAVPYDSSVEAGDLAYLGGSGASSDHNDPSSDHKAASSDHKAASSDHKAASSDHKDARSFPLRDETPMDEGVWRVLLEIAAPVRTRPRSTPAVTQQTIIKLCRFHPLTLNDLSELLARSQPSIRRYIRALEAAGALRPLHAQRTHPQQRYLAVVNEP